MSVQKYRATEPYVTQAAPGDIIMTQLAALHSTEPTSQSTARPCCKLGSFSH